MSGLIYDKLEKYWNLYKYKSYKNQNIEIAGEVECDELYGECSYDIRTKNKLSQELLNLLIKNINEENLESISMYMKKYHIIKYYFVLINKLKALINEDDSIKETIDVLGQRLVKSEDDNLIKLGLTLLKVTKNDSAVEIFKMFSNHNEFILYAIEGIKEYEKSNTIIFNICKSAKGYGKIIAVTNLEIMTPEIEIWAMENTHENEFLEPILNYITFDDERYLDYFMKRKSKRKYKLFTEKLELLMELKEFFREGVSIDIILAYYDYFTYYEVEFENINLIAKMINNILSKYKESELIEDTFIREKLEFILRYILNSDFRKAILDELNKPGYNKGEVLDLAKLIRVKIEFEHFIDILEENPLNYGVCEYIIDEGSEEEISKLIKSIDGYILSSEVISKEENISIKETEEYQYIYDKSLHLVVKNIENFTETFLALNVKALLARCIETRIEAFNNIKNFIVESTEYKDKIDEVIAKCSLEEKDEKLKRSMLRYLDGNKNNKTSRYENLKNIKVKPCGKDIFLKSIFIAGTNFVNLALIEKNLKAKKMVFFKREKNNLYDKNAIMVIADNGYFLGYIPRKDNYIMKNLMDNSKKIYGVIESVSEDFKEIKVNIYLSNSDVMDEVTEILNMMSNRKVGCLN